MAMVVLIVTWCRVAEAQQDTSDGETKRPFVNKIIFHGNSYFSDKKLRSQMRTRESTFFSLFKKPRLHADVLQRDIAVLEATYHANGFLEAEVKLKELVELEKGTFVDIVIDVIENEPTRIESVTFSGKGILSEETLRKDLLLKPGDPYNPSMLGSDINTIKLKYFDRGYLAVLVGDSVFVDDRTVTMHYNIDPGPVIAVRSIELLGNRHTKREIVEKEITLEVGKVFRLRDAVESQRNLFETGLFTEADILPEKLDLKTNTVAVLVRLRERKSKYFEVGFGVSNVVGSRVTGGWGDRNLFGTGRTVRVGLEGAFALFQRRDEDFNNLNPRVRYYRADITFAQRRVFGTKVLLGITAFAEKDATVENLVVYTKGMAVGGGRKLSEQTELTAGFGAERIKRETIVGESRSNTHSVLTAIRHDTRDFILDPRRGGFRDFRVLLAGGILGGDNDFYTLNATWQRYWPSWASSIFAPRIMLGYADSYGRSEVVPVENRFFTGGGNSVRGYDENSIGPRELVENSMTGQPEITVVGGRVFMLTNIEMRFPLPWLSRWCFSGAVFADGGNVWEDPNSVSFSNFQLFKNQDDVTQEDYRYSVGLGIRYNTPLGPIRLDYGTPLVVEPGGSSKGRFHFSLGQIF
jgi:outer membrane protein insertion porin family